jgi:nucleoid-associated protein YgaU
VDYTLFLPDATPVRPKVDLSLEQIMLRKEENAQRPKESPDHAKLYTVKKGDTLQGIATAEYDDPREWRRIAKTNNIDDPLELRPGMKLLVPPILK